MTPERAYLEELAARLRTELGGELVGVYAGGSFALGAYDPGRSDLDVAVVCRHRPARPAKERIVAALRHEALPCPACGLELVVYAEAAVRHGTVEALYELDLNTGPVRPFRAAFAPDDAPSLWYGIDRALLREHGVPIVGPPPGEVFGALCEADLLALLAESVRWHEEQSHALSDDAVLNACRAWRYASERRWSSKCAAADWARGRLVDPRVVDQAVRARSGSAQPERAGVEAFLRAVHGTLEEARRSAGSSRA